MSPPAFATVARESPVKWFGAGAFSAVARESPVKQVELGSKTFVSLVFFPEGSVDSDATMSCSSSVSESETLERRAASRATETIFPEAFFCLNDV